MRRDLLEQLTSWRDSPIRVPLILRGARQVGKSWLVDEFGKQFDNYIKINFEKHRAAKTWFEDEIDIESLLRTISLYKGQGIIPGKTLLFFDEIQDCKRALQSLRYFKEEMPDLHVIAAGSLIDFAIEEIGIPVGRVQFLYLYPISFAEYLTIIGRDDLRHYISNFNIEKPIHDLLLELLRNYMWLGGMPAVLKQWLESKDYYLCQAIQDQIIAGYQQDFHKYAKERQIPYVTQTFDTIPKQFGNKFKYSNIDQATRSIYFKEALSLLSKAGIVHICYHTNADRQPLGAEMNLKKFKVFFFDIGIAQRLLGFDIRQWLLNPLQLNNSGAIAEQLVAQELISYMPAHKKAQLYYWHREAKSSNAEIDFIILKDGHVIPIEVKSATSGRLRSLHGYLDNRLSVPYGVKISEQIYSKNKRLIEVPLYAIGSWYHSNNHHYLNQRGWQDGL